MINFYDSHNHIKKRLPVPGIYNTYKMNDFSDFNNIDNKYKCIGIHPLYISHIDYNLIETLTSRYNIGEVGLDRRGKNIEEQVDVLKYFIRLSKTYNRSISYHCVKAWGRLSDIISVYSNRDLPHLFHGFSGSYEIYKNLSLGNSFFSFSLRELKNDRIIRLLESIPIEKILIESDMSNDLYNVIGEEEYLNIIKNTYSEIAGIKKIPVEELAAIIQNNFKQIIKE